MIEARRANSSVSAQLDLSDPGASPWKSVTVPVTFRSRMSGAVTQLRTTDQP
jgi:hypothetical protein